jgi:hypothetical protein
MWSREGRENTELPWPDPIFCFAFSVYFLPFLEKLASFLVCGDEGAKTVLFRYSAILCLEKKESGRWAVDWFLKPEMV